MSANSRAQQILSPRELEVAQLAADGLTERQLAETLVISQNTVHTHLQKAYRKLGVRNRSQLAKAVLDIPAGPE